MSSTTESATVLTGMYAAEAEYLAAGGPGEASFDMVEQKFLATGETAVVLTQVRARARATGRDDPGPSAIPLPAAEQVLDPVPGPVALRHIAPGDTRAGPPPYAVYRPDRPWCGGRRRAGGSSTTTASAARPWVWTSPAEAPDRHLHHLRPPPAEDQSRNQTKHYCVLT